MFIGYSMIHTVLNILIYSCIPAMCVRTHVHTHVRLTDKRTRSHARGNVNVQACVYGSMLQRTCEE